MDALSKYSSEEHISRVQAQMQLSDEQAQEYLAARGQFVTTLWRLHDERKSLAIGLNMVQPSIGEEPANSQAFITVRPSCRALSSTLSVEAQQECKAVVTLAVVDP